MGSTLWLIVGIEEVLKAMKAMRVLCETNSFNLASVRMTSDLMGRQRGPTNASKICSKLSKQRYLKQGDM